MNSFLFGFVGYIIHHVSAFTGSHYLKNIFSLEPSFKTATRPIIGINLLLKRKKEGKGNPNFKANT